MSRDNDPDHPDYNDTNQGDYRETAEDKEISRLSAALLSAHSQRDAALAELAKAREERDAAVERNKIYRHNSSVTEAELRLGISHLREDLLSAQDDLKLAQRDNEALRKTIAMAAELLSDSAAPFDKACVLLREKLNL